MATLSYATAGTGPSAGGIGWINFGAGFSIAAGATITGLSVSLLDGSTMTFDVSNTAIAGGGFTYTSATSPTVADAGFGNGAYTGISGQVCLKTNTPGTTRTSRITLSNINVLDPSGNPVPNYTLIVANAEVTNAITEQQIYVTNGAAWELFYEIDSARTGPTISGVGTQTVTQTALGVAAGLASAPVFTTQNPTSVYASVTTDQQEAVTFGVALTKIEIDKVIPSRYAASDQFNLIISGTPSDTATTTGSSTGLQPIYAYVYGIPLNTYTITETMASGSYGWLSDYLPSVVWTNLAADGTVGPSPGALGDNITVALGDILTATITNNLNPNPPSRGVSFL